jgi:hypothetical protein
MVSVNRTVGLLALYLAGKVTLKLNGHSDALMPDGQHNPWTREKSPAENFLAMLVITSGIRGELLGPMASMKFRSKIRRTRRRDMSRKSKLAAQPWNVEMQVAINASCFVEEGAHFNIFKLESFALAA